jgi:hypothetical protein
MDEHYQGTSTMITQLNNKRHHEPSQCPADACEGDQPWISGQSLTEAEVRKLPKHGWAVSGSLLTREAVGTGYRLGAIAPSQAAELIEMMASSIGKAQGCVTFREMFQGGAVFTFKDKSPFARSGAFDVDLNPDPRD